MKTLLTYHHVARPHIISIINFHLIASQVFLVKTHVSFRKEHIRTHQLANAQTHICLIISQFF